jgi:hypothetical protein
MGNKEPIPDNLKSTILWLFEKWRNASHSKYKEDRWFDMEDFLADWMEIVLADDSILSEDAKELKREMLKL